MELNTVISAATEIYRRIGTTNLIGLLEQNSVKMSSFFNQSQRPVQERRLIKSDTLNSKDRTLAAISSIIPDALSNELAEAYDILNAYELFGQNGRDLMQLIYGDFEANNPEAVSKLNSYMTKVKDLSESMRVLSVKLSLSRRHAAEPRNLIILFFRDAVSIDNLEELSKISNKWNQNLIAFARLSQENDTNFRIERVERGSLILTISATAGVVLAFTKGLNIILDTIKKYYEIRKLAAELRKLKIDALNDNLADMEKKSEVDVKCESKKISASLLVEFNWKDEPDKEEVDTAVSKAIEQLIVFLTKGGRAETKLIKDSLPEESTETEIASKYKGIDSLKSEILAIEGEPASLQISEISGAEDI